MKKSNHDKNYNKHQKTHAPFLKFTKLKFSVFFGIILLLIAPLSDAGQAVKLLTGLSAVQAATVQGQITVGPDHFQQYFNLSGMNNGAAVAGTFDTSPVPKTAEYSYNPTNPSIDPSTGNPYGTLTLTSAKASQVGVATFKQKFDTSQNWSLVGQLNIGFPQSGTNSLGADGLGFGWVPNALGKTGIEGDQLGIGGLKGAFGWTADTYQNDYRSPEVHTLTDSKPAAPVGGTATQNADGSWTSSGNPNYLSTNTNTWAMGGYSFASPTLNNKTSNNIVAYNRSAAPQRSIYSLEDGNFHPYTMTYNASTGVVTTTFGGLSWSLPLSTLSNLAGNSTASALSFFITGSTGGQFNLQQFRFESLTYTTALTAGTVVTNYVDSKGNPLASPTSTIGAVGTSYTTNPLNPIPAGYRLISVTSTDSATVFNSTSHVGTGQYIQSGTVITYVYDNTPTYTIDPSSLKNVSETINYLWDNDKTTVLAPQKVSELTFVTVKNNVANTSQTYWINANVTTVPTINSDGTISGWTPVDSNGNASFSSVANPVLGNNSIVDIVGNPTGQTNQSDGGSHADWVSAQPSVIPSRTVTTSSTGLVYNVYYQDNSNLSFSDGKSVNETINYLDATTHASLASRFTSSITFVTVTNSLTGEQQQYDYLQGHTPTSVPIDLTNGSVNSGWTLVTTQPAQFSAQNNPMIPYYKWVSADAGDAQQVPVQTVDSTLDDVYYQQNYIFSNRTTKTVNETINYLDANSKTSVAPRYTTSKSVTFETVTAPSGNQSLYFYTGVGMPTADSHPFDGAGLPNSSWVLVTSQSISFDAQTNPTLANYSVVGADGNVVAQSPYLTTDKLQVTSQKVDNNFDDIEVTVYYAYTGQSIQLPFTGGLGIGLIVLIALGSALAAFVVQRGKKSLEKNKKR